jgi:hypothetical protein
MVTIHMVSNLKTVADVGLFVLFISLLLAALPELGFDNVRTGFALLGAALLCGLILIWTQIVNEFFPGYQSMHPIDFYGRFVGSFDCSRHSRPRSCNKAQLRSAGNLRSTVVTLESAILDKLSAQTI